MLEETSWQNQCRMLNYGRWHVRARAYDSKRCVRRSPHSRRSSLVNVRGGVVDGRLRPGEPAGEASFRPQAAPRSSPHRRRAGRRSSPQNQGRPPRARRARRPRRRAASAALCLPRRERPSASACASTGRRAAGQERRSSRRRLVRDSPHDRRRAGSVARRPWRRIGECDRRSGSMRSAPLELRELSQYLCDFRVNGGQSIGRPFTVGSQRRDATGPVGHSSLLFRLRPFLHR